MTNLADGGVIDPPWALVHPPTRLPVGVGRTMGTGPSAHTAAGRCGAEGEDAAGGARWMTRRMQRSCNRPHWPPTTPAHTCARHRSTRVVFTIAFTVVFLPRAFLPAQTPGRPSEIIQYKQNPQKTRGVLRAIAMISQRARAVARLMCDAVSRDCLDWVGWGERKEKTGSQSRPNASLGPYYCWVRGGG